MNFSMEESKENDFIIKAATGNIKTRTIRNLLFSLTLKALRINNQGALLLGLAKSMYYRHVCVTFYISTAIIEKLKFHESTACISRLLKFHFK